MSQAELLIEPVDGVQVHASTLLPRPSGVLLVAWFAGPREGHPDTGIQVLRRDGELVRLTPIAPQDPQPHWNPVLADGPDGRIWLGEPVRSVSQPAWTELARRGWLVRRITQRPVPVEGYAVTVNLWELRRDASGAGRLVL